MTATTRAFTPSFGSNVVINVTNVSSSNSLNNKKNNALCLTNSGAENCYVKIYDNNIEPNASASNSDYLVLAGTKEIITISKNHTHIAAITLSGTTTLDVITGYGV